MTWAIFSYFFPEKSTFRLDHLSRTKQETICMKKLSPIFREKKRNAQVFSWKVLIGFLFLDRKRCCGYSLEVPPWGISNEYPQHMFSSKNKSIMWIPSLICSYEKNKKTILGCHLIFKIRMLKLCFLAWLQMSTRKKILRVCRWHYYYSRVVFLAGLKKTYSASIMLLNFECQIWKKKKKKKMWLDYWMINPCDYMLSKFMLLWGGLSGSIRFASDWWTRKLQVWSLLVQQHLEIDHEIFSMVILSQPLIRQLKFSGKRMCTSTG